MQEGGVGVEVGTEAPAEEKQRYRGCNWNKRPEAGCEHLICEWGHTLQAKGSISP